MSRLGASRFTALLAAVAISGMAGTFWWALETRSDTKAATGHRSVVREHTKFPGRATSAKDGPPARVEPGRFELMGRSDRPQFGAAAAGTAGRNDDQVPEATLANYPGPVANPSSVTASSGPGFQSRGLQIPALPAAQQTPNAESLATPGSRADMPLPALLPPPAPPDPAPSSWQTKFPDPQYPITRAHAAPPVETPRRQARAGRAPKPARQSYYMEKYIDHGEYHLRRRPCEPPNMPDVCFMPQADRQPVLAAKQ